jgi:PKD repeat protein
MKKRTILLFVLTSITIIFSSLINGTGNELFSSVSDNSIIFDKRTCGSAEYMEMLQNEDPSYRDWVKGFERFALKYAEEHKFEKDSRNVITIPCVVHVVWNTPQQNISEDQIFSQIDILNKDFRRLNADTTNTPPPFKPLGADCELEFRLARRDPNNNPTLGITRTQTNITEFGLNSILKFTASGGHDAWDRDRYLNLWVANLGGGLLGYATFPGGNPSLDGVAIGFNYFGSTGVAVPPFNKGRTGTHEIGHWLSLYHIWGDDNGSCAGTDFVDDTPNQALEFYNCPSYPQVDACTPNSPGVMFMNYMDYTDDACMNLFTQGQLARINATMNGPRLPIQSSNGHVNVSGVPLCTFRADSVSIGYSGQVNFSDLSAGIPTSWQWTFNGGTPAASTQQNPVITYNTPGLYTVKLRISNSFGSDSLTRTAYIRVRGATMSAFNIVSPPTFSRVAVAAGDTSKVNFTWTKSSVNPTVNYKVKIRKLSTQTDYVFPANSGGIDTVAGIGRNVLDSIAALMGTAGDSVRCTWRVFAFNGVDSLASTNSFVLTLVRGTIGIQVISAELPASYALYSNYPNPFNPVTKIRFDIPGSVKNSFVNIAVFDILGKQSYELVNNELKAGKYEVTWNAAEFPSGVYFYRISAGNFTQTRKMILVK